MVSPVRRLAIERIAPPVTISMAVPSSEEDDSFTLLE